jgi:D-glycero-beta-D-manno-heptose-7-phosphate kinase
MTILVCGDAMLDEYWFGDVSRISPEAPVPVLTVKRTETREGAAANVARNVRALGSICRTEFGAPELVVRKIRPICRNHQMLRLDFDNPQIPVAKDIRFERGGVVIFSDYGKGALAHVQCLILRAKIAGCTVLVDPKGYDYERYRYADVVKPNLDEMRVMVGGWKDEADLTAKAQELRKKADIGAILLTRAADGMTLYTAEGADHIQAEEREIFDVTGAGDTAIAALAVSMARGHDLRTAARYANKAAGIVVERFGTAVATESEVFA